MSNLQVYLHMMEYSVISAISSVGDTVAAPSNYIYLSPFPHRLETSIFGLEKQHICLHTRWLFFCRQEAPAARGVPPNSKVWRLCAIAVFAWGADLSLNSTGFQWSRAVIPDYIAERRIWTKSLGPFDTWPWVNTNSTILGIGMFTGGTGVLTHSEYPRREWIANPAAASLTFS